MGDTARMPASLPCLCPFIVLLTPAASTSPQPCSPAVVGHPLPVTRGGCLEEQSPDEAPISIIPSVTPSLCIPWFLQCFSGSREA